MHTITVEDKVIEVTEDGYLANTSEWTPEIAVYIAAVEGIRLNEHHWAVLNFLRDYYKLYKVAPRVKLLIKEIGNKLGSDKGKVKYLSTLYPCGLAVQACKIAGLPGAAGCV
jgi:TusE/DsrC/DsvC family sulfur relay protein